MYFLTDLFSFPRVLAFPTGLVRTGSQIYWDTDIDVYSPLAGMQMIVDIDSEELARDYGLERVEPPKYPTNSK